MFNSQSAPSTARGLPPGEGGYRGYVEAYPRQNAAYSQGKLPLANCSHAFGGREGWTTGNFRVPSSSRHTVLYCWE